MTAPMQRVDSVVRWEGNNIAAFYDFLKGIPVRVEKCDGMLDIKVYACDGIVLPEAALALEILLRDGDGLMREGQMLGVARNIVFADEESNDKPH